MKIGKCPGSGTKEEGKEELHFFSQSSSGSWWWLIIFVTQETYTFAPMGGGGQCLVIVNGVEPYNMHSSFLPKDQLKIKKS